MESKRQKTVQHRAPREGRDQKELQDLRRENHRLKKNVKKLQKTSTKLLDQVQLSPEVDDEDHVPATFLPVPRCSKCNGSDLTQTKIYGGKTLVVCNGCQAMEVKKGVDNGSGVG